MWKYTSAAWRTGTSWRRRTTLRNSRCITVQGIQRDLFEGARYRKTFAADQGQVTFDSVSLPEGEAYLDGEDLLTWR